MSRLGKLFSRRRKRYLVVDALADYQRDTMLRGCRAQKSLRSEIGIINRHMGDVPLADVTTAMLRRYQSERRSEGAAAATVNKHLAVLSASAPRFPRRLRPAPPRQGFLQRDDYEAIRAELPAWGRPVLDLGWYCGWRKNELLTLSRAEVDLPGRQIRLHPDRSKNGDTRVLPLRGWGLEAVETALAVPNESGTVFGRDGRRISSTTWHETWRLAVRCAERQHLRFHDLRRSVVRRMELQGVPRKTAMAWVGHRTESIYQRYAITTERDLVDAAEKMVRRMDPEPPGGKVVPIFPR